jgi:hypothetical protein
MKKKTATKKTQTDRYVVLKRTCSECGEDFEKAMLFPSNTTQEFIDAFQIPCDECFRTSEKKAEWGEWIEAGWRDSKVGKPPASCGIVVEVQRIEGVTPTPFPYPSDDIDAESEVTI